MSAAVEPLRAILPAGNWVVPELLHMTVKFLGEQSRETADTLAAQLDEVTRRYRVIPYEVGGVGAFPNLRRPHVVWMGIHADSKLELLCHDVEEVCVASGVPLDGRPFRPHITLGRVRHAGREALRDFVTCCRGIEFNAPGEVRSVDLMHSHRIDNRLTYSLLHRAPLPAPESAR